MAAAADAAPGNLDPEFTDHAGDVHEYAPGSQYGKIRAKANGDNGFTDVLFAEPVMHFTGGFPRRGEREFVGMDFDIDQEQMGIIRKDTGDHMGHACTHLVLDHGVCPVNEKGDKLPVAFRVAREVKDVLDDLPAIIEPEPELLIVKGERYILACFLRILFADERKEECPFRGFAAVTDAG